MKQSAPSATNESVWLSVQRLGIVAGVLALAVAAGVLLSERPATPETALFPREAFTSGTIGTELLPSAVLRVLPELTRAQKHFAPLGDDAGDWIQQFGFLRAGDDSSLPFGFTRSHYRPRSGSLSSVEFVGIGCAVCHTSDIVRPDGSTFRVVGTGNSSLNIFAWLDAVQAALLERDETGQYRVTVDAIATAHERGGFGILGLGERLTIRLWLKGFRETLEENLPRFDDPFGNGRSLEVDVTPTGPGRTQPFRTLVRTVLRRPGSNLFVYTKVAPVYHENWQEWAQVDGGIRGLNYRSALAVLAAGATLQNMQVPEIEQNIVAATDFVRELSGPRYVDVFPDQSLDRQAIERGGVVYRTHCFACHGEPSEAGGWKKGPQQGEITPLDQIGTDPDRVTFRHGGELPQALFDHFPAGHPFKFPREDIRAPRGYLNEPIDSTFTRAPYLHNASILTLAELINLKPRRAVFYRGRNKYDPQDVGLSSSDRPDKSAYFRFDIRERGNSNAGHDYPWSYESKERNESQLRDLLEYLKTL